MFFRPFIKLRDEIPEKIWSELLSQFKGSNSREFHEELKTVHVPEIYKSLQGQDREPAPVAPEHNRTESVRLLDKKPSQLWMVYPSGRRVLARVVVGTEEVLLEPVEANFAYYVLSKSDYENTSEIDLKEIDHMRIVHSPKNNETVREWFNL